MLRLSDYGVQDADRNGVMSLVIVQEERGKRKGEE
jgi:hypothetical protein